MLEEVAGGQEPPRIIFHPATGVTAVAVGQAQASLRRRILRAFVGRGLLEGFEAKEMRAYRHSGFSVDTSVCIAAQDRAGLERLLRYCGTAAGKGARGVSHPRLTQPESAQPVQPKRPAHNCVGGAHRPHLRGVPAGVPDLRRANANSIAFITYSADIGQILDHIGADAEPPRITPARGPPLWDGCDAQMGEGVDDEIEPDWDEAAQPAPVFEADQRVSW